MALLIISALLVIVAVLCGFLENDGSTVGFSKVDVEVPHMSLTTTRSDVYIGAESNEGTKIHGWLYKPKGASEKLPVVIFAHGFCAQKDMVIDKLADKFASELNVVALSFDYRTFGASDGHPRHIWNPSERLGDWMSVLDFVIDKGGTLGIDGKRISLWGTSWSGGIVLQVAGTYSRREHIHAVISQVPAVHDPNLFTASNTRNPIMWTLKLTVAAMKDLAMSALGLGRYYVQIVPESEEDSTLTMLSTTDSYQYMRMIQHPHLGGWQNRMAAGVMFAIVSRDYTKIAADIKAATLMLYSTTDTYQDPKILLEMAEKMPNVTVVPLSEGHYDPYVEPHLSTIATMEIEFLRKAL